MTPLALLSYLLIGLVWAAFFEYIDSNQPIKQLEPNDWLIRIVLIGLWPIWFLIFITSFLINK